MPVPRSFFDDWMRVAGEEAKRAHRVLDTLVVAQLHRIEAAALQQRQHVDQHLAAGAQLAAELVARTQHAGLRVGAAVGPLGKAQHQQRQPRAGAAQVGSQRVDLERVR